MGENQRRRQGALGTLVLRVRWARSGCRTPSRAWRCGTRSTSPRLMQPGSISAAGAGATGCRRPRSSRMTAGIASGGLTSAAKPSPTATGSSMRAALFCSGRIGGALPPAQQCPIFTERQAALAVDGGEAAVGMQREAAHAEHPLRRATARRAATGPPARSARHPSGRDSPSRSRPRRSRGGRPAPTPAGRRRCRLPPAMRFGRPRLPSSRMRAT